MGGLIFAVDRNVHGAWVIYGTEGVKQFYGYTNAEAINEYKKTYKEVYNHADR